MTALFRAASAIYFRLGLAFLFSLAMFDIASAQPDPAIVKLMFENTTSENVTIVYVHQGQEGGEYDPLTPGEKRPIESYDKVVWRFKQGTKVVGEYVTKPAAEQSYAIKVAAVPMPDEPDVVRISLHNTTTKDVTIVYVDRGQEGGEYEALKPDETRVIDSYEKVVWRFKQGNLVLADYVTKADANQSFAIAGKMTDPAPAPKEPPALKVTFGNTTDADVTLVYVDGGREAGKYEPIKSGGTLTVDSYEGVVWRFKQGATSLGQYVTTASEKQGYTIVGAMKLQLLNDLPRSVDVALVNSNNSEKHLTTLAPPSIQYIDRKPVFSPAKVVSQETANGQVFRFRVRKAAYDAGGKVTGEAPQGESLFLFDYAVKPAQIQTVRINPTEFLQQQLKPGIEVALFDPEQGLILIDDHPTERFGAPVNRYRVRLRREGTVVDEEHKHDNFVWIVTPGNTGKADTISFNLKGYPKVYLSSDYPRQIPGRKLLGVADRPETQDPKDPALDAFNQATTFNIRPIASPTRLGLALQLERSDVRYVVFAPVEVEKPEFSVQLHPDGSKTTSEYDPSKRVTTIKTYAPDGTETGVRKAAKPPKGADFTKPAPAGGPPAADTPQVLLVPWGASATQMSLASMRAVGLEVDSGASWLAKDPVPMAQPDPDQIKDDAAAGAVGSDQVSSVLGYARCGYHQIFMNPAKLESNGLDGARGNPIFARRSDRTAGQYRLEGNYRVPLDFFLETRKDGEETRMSRLCTSQDELMNTVAGGQSLIVDTNVSVGGTFGVPPVQASATVGTNMAFGGGSEFARMISSNSSKTDMLSVRSKWSAEFWLMLNKKEAALSQAFRRDFLALREKKSRAAFDEFFKKYGTHYPIASYFGGKATEVEVISMASLTHSVKYDRGNNLAVGHFKSNRASSDGSTTGFSTENRNAHVVFSGGDGTNYDGWSKSNVVQYVPIKVYLRPIWELSTADLLFDSPTAADQVVASHLRLAMIEHWQRHLRDAETGVPTRYNPPVDYYEVRIDNPRIQCAENEARREFHMGFKNIELMFRAVMLKDTSPLGGNLPNGKVPDEYGLGWWPLLDEDQLAERQRTESVGKEWQHNFKTYKVDLNKGEHDLKPLGALIAARRPDVPNSQPGNERIAIRAFARMNKTATSPAIGHIGGDKMVPKKNNNPNFVEDAFAREYVLGDWWDLGYVEGNVENAQTYLADYDAFVRNDPAVKTKWYDSYALYHFMDGRPGHTAGRSARMPEGPGFPIVFLSWPLAKMVKDGVTSSRELRTSWFAASDVKLTRDAPDTQNPEKGTLRKFNIQLDHGATIRHLPNSPPPASDGFKGLRYFERGATAPPAIAAPQESDTFAMQVFPNGTAVRSQYSGATKTFTITTVAADGTVVDVIKNRKE